MAAGRRFILPRTARLKGSPHQGIDGGTILRTDVLRRRRRADGERLLDDGLRRDGGILGTAVRGAPGLAALRRWRRRDRASPARNERASPEGNRPCQSGAQREDDRSDDDATSATGPLRLSLAR
jgi:hypothetical protein